MVLIEEEEDENNETSRSTLQINSKDGGTTRIENVSSAEVGQDTDDEGFETASEGEDEEREVDGKDVKDHAGSDHPLEREVVSSSDEITELENKLGQVGLQELQPQGLEAANAAKAQGNALYGEGKFVEALQAYDRGLRAVPLKEGENDPAVKEIRAILFSNRAACYIGLDNNDAAIKECTKALELNPDYVKALMRRVQAREKLTYYEEAVADLNKVLEIEPGNGRARSSLRTIAPLAEEKREKLKAEMLGKLKEAGNSILGHFGMSVDNFKTVQDPNTGSYSIQFQR